jgi:thiazole tautomerase (transcriptional regulator TenI)
VKKELHAVTTRDFRSSDLIRIAVQIEPYIDFLHLRRKDMPAKQLYEIVMELNRSGFPHEKIIINDRLDVALVKHRERKY